MQKQTEEITRNRVKKFRENHLLGGKIYKQKTNENLSLTCWAAPDRIPFSKVFIFLLL